jgi:HSP20 family protein
MLGSLGQTGRWSIPNARDADYLDINQYKNLSLSVSTLMRTRYPDLCAEHIDAITSRQEAAMLTRFDPFTELARHTVAGPRVGPVTSSSMPIDVYRHDDTVHIVVDVPGVADEDLDVTVERNAVTITAERDVAIPEDGSTFVSERAGASRSRTVRLGEALDSEQLSAQLDNGVLHLTVPVSAKAQARKVEVSHGALAELN